jgi:hypothetical protein
MEETTFLVANEEQEHPQPIAECKIVSIKNISQPDSSSVGSIL